MGSRRSVRFWSVASRGEVKLSIPYGSALRFTTTEDTPHGSTVYEYNDIAFGLDNRLLWSWIRLERNQGKISAWAGAYESIVDKHFDPHMPDWREAMPMRELQPH